jgi:hypothetical protein
VFAEAPGSYDICPVCGWEDDALQLEFPTTLAGGANALTLFEAQRFGAASQSQFECEQAWRPIDMAVDDFEDFHEPDRRRAPMDDPTTLYYWRPTFWRHQADTSGDSIV